MGNETSKANPRRLKDYRWDEILKGRGIDIGCGRDCLSKIDFPNIEFIESFDKKDGDAQFILNYKKPETYDFVYSSHCLEHLNHVQVALIGWWKLVKKGGNLVLLLPDEDLYEQGRFKTKSRWSREHKHSFTIYKINSWCHWSINVFEMLQELSNCKIKKIELVDTNYDYNLPHGKQDQSSGIAEVSIEVICQKV